MPNNFSFDVARKIMAQGILPTTISSDAGSRPENGSNSHDVDISRVGIKAGTDSRNVYFNPARAIRVEDMIGSLKPGMEADISILDIISGTWRLQIVSDKR